MKATIGELKAWIRERQEQQKKLFEQMAPLQEQVRQLGSEITAYQRQLDQAELEAGFGWKRALFRVAENGIGSEPYSRALRERLDRYDMLLGGYWSDVMEGVIQIKCARNEESTQKNETGVYVLAPLLAVHDDRRVWFEVFNHTLCAGGVVELRMTRNFKRIELMMGRRVEKKFETVAEAMAYIRKNYWYE